MKKLCSLLSIWFILGFFSVIYSGQERSIYLKTRTAVIVDKKGVSTELKRLRINCWPKPYYYSRGRWRKIAIITEPFVVVIPNNNLMSIVDTEDRTKNKRIFDVSYYWMGEKKTISGSLMDDVQFSGPSDFGKVEIYSADLKQLIFSQVSDRMIQIEKFNPEGYVLLRDGTKLEFEDLKRHGRSSERYKKLVKEDFMTRTYEWDSRTVDNYMADIYFYRGESRVHLKFKELKSIEFEDQDCKNMVVTLKNGASTKGKTAVNSGVLFNGLTGVFEKGEFYLERKDIRNVHFY